MSLSTQLPTTNNYVPSPVLTYLARGAPTTRRTRGYRAEQLASWFSNGMCDAISFPWWDLQYEQLIAMRLKLLQQYAPGTVNGYIDILRGLLKECWRLGLVDGDQYRRICDVPGVTDDKPPPGRDVQVEELQAMLRTLEQEGTLIAVRDAAMLVTLYGTGMRSAELCKLRLLDYDPHDCSFLVQGKGRRDRRAYGPSWVREPLATWLEIRGAPPGALFVNMEWGKMDPKYRHLNPNRLYHIVRRRAQLAGLPHTTTHDFRRTNISNLLDAGVDLVTVGKNVGQKNPKTTAKYDRRSHQARKAKVELLTSPL